MTRPSALLCAALTLAACRLDLTEPIGPSQPWLELWVSLTDSAPAATGHITAYLWPGRDSGGAVRRVPDPALYVAGMTLAPSAVSELGELSYQADWTFAPEGFEGLLLDVVPPNLPGVLQAAPPVAFAPWRASPSAVSLRRGEDLVLGLTAPGDSLRAVSGIWSLTVVATQTPVNQGLLFHASGRGPIRLPLVIPGAWLANVEENQLEAEFFLQQQARADEPSGGLEIGLLVNVRLRWRLTVT